MFVSLCTGNVVTDEEGRFLYRTINLKNVQNMKEASFVVVNFIRKSSISKEQWENDKYSGLLYSGTYCSNPVATIDYNGIIHSKEGKTIFNPLVYFTYKKLKELNYDKDTIYSFLVKGKYNLWDV